MRMVFPPAPMRARILQGLFAFYETEKRSYLRAALAEWAKFYNVKMPVVQLRRLRKEGIEYVLGRTNEDNVVTLWPPAAWKTEADTPKIKFTPAEYVDTILHELAHCLYFVDMEARADLYAARFVRQPKEAT